MVGGSTTVSHSHQRWWQWQSIIVKMIIAGRSQPATVTAIMGGASDGTIKE